MNKKILVLIFMLFLVTGCSIKKEETKQIKPQDNPNAIILYYSDTCSHCQQIEGYITQYQIDKKIEIIKKEISKSLDNAVELTERATKCNMPNLDQLGVPFIYYKEKCYMGYDDVLKIINEQAQIK